MKKEKNIYTSKGFIALVAIALFVLGYCLYAYDAQPKNVLIEKNIIL